MTFSEEMQFPFNFLTPVEVTVEETVAGVAMITGTLLVEGLSRNKNLYTIQEMAKIAKSAEGVPIYTGTMTKKDPNTGLMTKNMHANVTRNKIGKIVKTVFDKVKRKIKFWAEIVNTAKFPTLIQEVKKGWGVSIGGMAHGARWVFKKFGKVRKLVLDIRDMVVNHVQLIPPTTVRGQKEAKVESVAIQETMLFAFVTKINITVKDGSGVKVLDVS
jgi:hypothetical protein